MLASPNNVAPGVVGIAAGHVTDAAAFNKARLPPPHLARTLRASDAAATRTHCLFSNPTLPHHYCPLAGMRVWSC